MKRLLISPLAAALGLLAPPSTAAVTTEHVFHGTLCQPISGSGGAVSYWNGISSSSKTEGATVVCPISRTLPSDAALATSVAAVYLSVEEGFFGPDITCTLYLTNAAGLTEYSATAASVANSLVGFKNINVGSRYGRLLCTLPPLASIRSYEVIDWAP